MKDKFARMLGKSNKQDISELSARLGLADDVIYYIDPANGSDTTGDGSELSPFATVGHANSLIPSDLGTHQVVFIILGNFSEEIEIVHHNGLVMISAASAATLSNGFISLDGNCLYAVMNIGFDGSYLEVATEAGMVTCRAVSCTFSNLVDDAAIIVDSASVYLMGVTINNTCATGIDSTLGTIYCSTVTNSAVTPIARDGGLIVNTDGTLL